MYGREFKTAVTSTLTCKLLNYSFHDLVIEGEERTSQDYCYKLDTKNTKKKLKWKSKINLEKGILKIYKYYKKNPQYLKI